MDSATQKILAYSLDENITPSQLSKSSSFSDFFSNPDNCQKAEQLQSRMDSHNVIGILDDNALFPSRIFSTPHHPHIIYAMGNLQLLSSKTLGIVGPRNMSSYGDQVMHALFQTIRNHDLVTVSGMARGVDYLCHQLSIAYHLPTIAILGGGIRYFWNTSARHFMQEIIDNGGLILSEFKLDFKPTVWSFPQRNRLIAGLSDVLFLPEAREGSGSLITANYAYDMHKKIFVAPNSLFSDNSIGSNALVSQGRAILLNNFNQILQCFDGGKVSIDKQNHDDIYTCQYAASDPNDSHPKYHENAAVYDISSSDKNLLSIISKHRDQDLSTWINEVSADYGTALMQITDLEMKGYIDQPSPGLYFVKLNFI